CADDGAGDGGMRQHPRDRLHLESTQAVLALAPDRVRLQHAMSVSPFVPTQTALGEDIGPLAPPRLQSAGHDLFGVAHSVDGRGVDPVDAQFQGAMDRGDRRLIVLRTPTELIAWTPDRPGTQANRCDAEIGIA